MRMPLGSIELAVDPVRIVLIMRSTEGQKNADGIVLRGIHEGSTEDEEYLIACMNPRSVDS